VAAAGGSVDAVGGSAVGYCAWVLVPGRVLAGDDGMALELPPVTCGLPCRGRYCAAHEAPAREAEEELRRAFVAGSGLRRQVLNGSSPSRLISSRERGTW
jgi:hypothetical protein